MDYELRSKLTRLIFGSFAPILIFFIPELVKGGFARYILETKLIFIYAIFPTITYSFIIEFVVTKLFKNIHIAALASAVFSSLVATLTLFCLALPIGSHDFIVIMEYILFYFTWRAFLIGLVLGYILKLNHDKYSYINIVPELSIQESKQKK